MSDPNQAADDIFNSDHDSDDDFVSSADDQVSAQPTEQSHAEPEAAPGEPEASSEPEASADAGKEPDQGRFVPVGELQSERKKRQEEARLREEAEANAQRYQAQIDILTRQQAAQPVQQPPQQQLQQEELPDPYEDPEGYTNAVVETRFNELDRRVTNMMLNLSESNARSTHGNEVVDAAVTAATNAGIAGRFVQAPDAYGEIVKWHRQQQALQTIGDDPDAYRQNLEKQIREQVLAELKSGGQVVDHQPNGNGQPAPQGQPQHLPGSLVDAPAQGAQGRQMSQQGLADQLFDSERDRSAP